jgi:8-oxo-dGTP pyrophosphatase MutT (NUDIX family)
MTPRIRVAAVVYRDRGAEGIEFLLVRTSAGDRWTFPKGGVEAGDPAPADAAAREAVEEAGAGGVVDPIPLCHYTHLARADADRCLEQVVEAYLLRATGADGEPEPGRAPTWFPAGRAIEALAENQLAAVYADEARRVVEAAIARVGAAGVAEGKEKGRR